MTAERRSRVRLEGLSDRQLAFLCEVAEDWLVAKAEDLPKEIRDADGTGHETDEVAGLGRLVAGLRRRELRAPDPIVRELVARTIGETRHLDELREEYEQELGEHESWVALLACLDPTPDDEVADAGGDEDDGPEASGDESPGIPASPWIELDGRLSEDQVRIVLKEVTGALAGRTGDLRLLHRHPEPEREVDEIAALARLAFWLARSEIQVPDPVAREMVGRLAEGSKDLNEWEELRERYESGMAEHEALAAFARILSEDAAPTEGVGDA